MYSNVDNDDIFASAMEEAEIVENPFVQGGDGEPLHAVDAAKRLLDNDEEEAFSSNNNNNNEGINVYAGSQSQASGSGIGNSLLERIQQQKKQQNPTTIPAGNVSDNVSSMQTEQATESQFGYPMVEEGVYSSSGTNHNVRIPEYSQVPSPSPYNTSSPYNMANTQNSADYKGQMMNVLSAVGSAAGVAAKSAYQGTKTLYGKMTSKNSNTGLSNAGGMAEMDYQRESLLMDPHDLEDRAAPMMTGSVPPTSTTSATGMRAGVIAHNTEDGNSFLNYAKQFAVDIKDLFLGASRRVQIGVIALIALIFWLIFFE